MSNHPNELIVKVLRAIESREWPATHVCRAYGLPHQTVKHWQVNGLAYYEKKLAAEKRLVAVANNHTPIDAQKMPAELFAVKELIALTNAPTSDAVTTLHIPDLHAPFAHQDALPFLLEVHNSRRCGRVVCAGDETDQHALGRWPKDPEGLGVGKEIQAAIDQLIPFYKAFPQVYVCESNHTVRAYKRAFEASIPSAFLRAIETVLNAPDGWVWGEHWVFDDVLYVHGDPFHGENAARKHMHENYMSVAIGHTHSYGKVSTFQTRFKKLFALDSGCLIDESAYAFKYAKKMNRRATLGCGVVYNSEHAEFVPMHTDAHGRWTGKL